MLDHGDQWAKDLAVKMSSEISASNIERIPEGWVYFCCKLAFIYAITVSSKS